VIAAIRLTPLGYHSAVPLAAALVVVAFVALLGAAEVCGAYGTPVALVWRRRLQVAALPLLLGSAVVIAIRLVPFIR
jgi:hypothetical protein